MFLSAEDKNAIKNSWRLVVPIKDTAAELFYRRLFELKPDYRSLFKTDMKAQRAKLIAMLAFVVRTLDWPDAMWEQDVEQDDDLFLVVLALGRRHSKLYNIPIESYDTVGQALLYALDYGLGKAFTPELKAAWARMYNALAVTMKMGESSVEMGTPLVAPLEEEGEVA